MMITADAAYTLFGVMLEVTLLAWLISRLIIFIPDLMISILKKVKNKSFIYRESKLDQPSLDTSLDKSEYGLKTLIDRWFKF